MDLSNTNRHVYIHIGFGKTGTSSIQDMMFTGRMKLAEAGILYPEVGLHGSAHHLLSNVSNRGGNNPAVISQLQKIRDVFLSGPYTKLVISSENLCFSTQELTSHYKDAFSDFGTKIIVFVRRQEALIESAFLEWVKQGWDHGGSVERYFKHHHGSFEFTNRIAPWVTVFGKQAIEAHLYDSRLANDVNLQFLRAIDVSAQVLPSGTFRSNTSLLPDFAELVGIIDKAGVPSEIRREAIDLLIGLSKQFKSCSQTRLVGEALGQEIRDRYASSNRDFAEEYLSAVERDLFLEDKVIQQTHLETKPAR